MTDYLETVETDINRLQERYDQVVDELDRTWRALTWELKPDERARLEQLETTLTQAARELAGRHALAAKALETLRCRN